MNDLEKKTLRELLDKSFDLKVDNNNFHPYLVKLIERLR
jgi:hypothetical protein